MYKSYLMRTRSTAAKEASLDLVFFPTDGVEGARERLVEGELEASSSDPASSSFVSLFFGRHGFVFFSGLFLFLEGTSAFLDFYTFKKQHLRNSLKKK